MVIKYTFKGLMAPVFTPFNSENQLTLNEIPKYAETLNNAGVKGILVNGTVGEGYSMSVAERKLVTEAWVKAAKNTGQSIMVHIGGVNFQGVAELARHAEELNVSALLCLSDLFFRPATPDDLVHYLSKVSQNATKTPLLYYHIPSFTGLNISMKEFAKKATVIPTFAGFKYTGNNLEEAHDLILMHDGAFSLFLGNDYIIPGALSMGIDSFIVTSLNFAPNLIKKMLQLSNEDAGGDSNKKSLQLQRTLTKFINSVTEELHWIPGFKAVTSFATNISLGKARLPLTSPSEQQLEKMKQNLNHLSEL